MIYYKAPISGVTDFALNFVTCVVYLMMPVTILPFYVFFLRRKRRRRYYIGFSFIIILIVANVVNIFYPLFFYHEQSNMHFLPMGSVMHILFFLSFSLLLTEMIVSKTFDYEDTFLAGFVGVTMLIGLVASWVNYDLKTLWLGMGISYLLLYLAISSISNKRDAITGLPNRNAYERTAARLKNNYKSVLMIDLNGLKKFNDTQGHIVGDSYIYATARTLVDAFDGCGELFRVGGDEFCLISKLSGDTLEDIAKKVQEKGKCNEKYGNFDIDFAYGVAEREEGDLVTDVYVKADRLMYENKKQYKSAR